MQEVCRRQDRFQDRLIDRAALTGLRCKPEARLEKQQRFSPITEQGLAGLKRLIGVPIEESVEPWCYEATRDNIRHWAHGIGDDNPLWCDPNYAATTQHGRVLAPPS